MELSRYQEEILEAVQQRLKTSPKKGLIVEALAGCGKSTMLWLMVKELAQQGFQPSEVVAVVFGKKNQLDLESKMKSKVGKEWGTCVRTIHSLCYEVYRSALNVPHKRVQMESDKYRQIAKDFKFLTYKRDQEEVTGTLLEGRHPAIYEEKDFLNLLDLLRLYCKPVTEEEVEVLTELYGLGINKIDGVTRAAQKCLDKGMSEAIGGRFSIDPTDMVYVPWYLREDARFRAAIAKKRAALKALMTDECQDTDILQLEMLSLLVDPARCFVTAVGDRWQAVYFFRGCLNDGIDKMGLQGS